MLKVKVHILPLLWVWIDLPKTQSLIYLRSMLDKRERHTERGRERESECVCVCV